jgi:hypothetical protein
MKYFFEIENWQKYFGFIFKQGSNVSTTSMHPMPLPLLWGYTIAAAEVRPYGWSKENHLHLELKTPSTADTQQTQNLSNLDHASG